MKVVALINAVDWWGALSWTGINSFFLTFSIIAFIALTFVTGYLQIFIALAFLGAMCLNTNTLIIAYVLRHMPSARGPVSVFSVPFIQLFIVLALI